MALLTDSYTLLFWADASGVSGERLGLPRFDFGLVACCGWFSVSC
jgi:hypothetical protein